MTVTAELYAQYDAHKQLAVDYARSTYGTDLSDIDLVIIPTGAGIDCGTAGNPAIYLNKASQADKVTQKYTNPLSEYKLKHTDEDIRSERIVLNAEKGKCVLVKEMPAETAQDKLLLVAILWHELGHGFNERKPQANNEQTAYRFEIEMLGADEPWRYLQGLSVADHNLFWYLMYRFPQYVTGPPPPEETVQKMQELVKRLCAPRFVGAESQAPTGALKFTVPIKGNLFKDSNFQMNLQSAIAQNNSAMQQGVCAVIAGSVNERNKIRPWVWLCVADQWKTGKNIKLSRFESTNNQAEVRFYQS